MSAVTIPRTARLSTSWRAGCSGRRPTRSRSMARTAWTSSACSWRYGQEVDLLRRYREHLSELDREIDRLYRLLHPVDVLRTLPGIGDVLAPALLGVLHTAARFGAQRRLRGFCGLFPRRHESGGVAHARQPITQDGNNRVKRDLVLAADVARTVDPELAAVYYRCMVEKGHHHRQALCAVATRLVNRIHAVLREGRPYELRGLEG